MRFPRIFIRSAAVLFAVIAIIVGLSFDRTPLGGRHTDPAAFELGPDSQLKRVAYQQRTEATLRGGVAWINSGPIAMSELRGKIVLLDFWTFCCINCHHILPVLAKLEEKYKDELVVIGVHSAKFDAERDTENIRRKVAEYRIKHPVINDARMALWNHYHIEFWPTLVLIDARGYVHSKYASEGHDAEVDRDIELLIKEARARGELNTTPLKFSPEMERPVNGPLLYPGKVLADATGKRLFITDTGHNRIIQSTLDGADPVAIGSGQQGLEDGTYEKATFNRPQGLCLVGNTLYVADTENHVIRAVDLGEQKVSTVAGLGFQYRGWPPPHVGVGGPALQNPLSSPWDVIQVGDEKALYIAMAGIHQIWRMDLTEKTLSVFAGTGEENIVDGPAATANFAQPSGLATDGENLFVADSEVSGVRVITGIRTKPVVQTIVGQGLFKFGDIDGRGATVRLQHCLGLSYGGGHLYIADSYNNRIKICEPRHRSVHAFVGSHKPGESDDPPHFYEPGGLSVTADHMYVADTDNHKVRKVDLKTHAVKTLALEGLTPPRLSPPPPSFPNKRVIEVAAAELAPGNAIELDVSLPLPKGYKLNAEVPLVYLIETPEKTGVLGPEVLPEGQKIKPPVTTFAIKVPLAKPAEAGDKFDLRLSLQTFVCSETSSLCAIKSYVWNIPVTFQSSGGQGAIKLSSEGK